jgi:16S rRNA (guanine527-N7)-methyltransferase
MANPDTAALFCELRSFLTDVDVPAPEPDFDAAVMRLYERVEEANQRVNLTRISGFEDFLIKHVADSLLGAAAIPELHTEELRVADVGCGAGFPGLVLALAYPNLQLTEIDSTKKKTVCTEAFISDLSLDNARAVNGRAIELGRQRAHHNAYDVVTARAVAAVPKLILECKGLLKPGGALLAYKTPQGVADEAEATEEAAYQADMEVLVSDIFELPDDAGSRQFWILIK